MPFRPISSKSKVDSSGNVKEDKSKKKQKEELITLEEERLYRQGTVAIKDLIAPSALRVESSFLQLGEVPPLSQIPNQVLKKKTKGAWAKRRFAHLFAHMALGQ